MIEPVPDEKYSRRVEPDERRLELEMLGQMLMQQRTDLQAPRRALPQERHQAVEGLPRVEIGRASCRERVQIAEDGLAMKNESRFAAALAATRTSEDA